MILNNVTNLIEEVNITGGIKHLLTGLNHTFSKTEDLPAHLISRIRDINNYERNIFTGRLSNTEEHELLVSHNKLLDRGYSAPKHYDADEIRLQNGLEQTGRAIGQIGAIGTLGYGSVKSINNAIKNRNQRIEEGFNFLHTINHFATGLARPFSKLDDLPASQLYDYRIKHDDLFKNTKDHVAMFKKEQLASDALDKLTTDYQINKALGASLRDLKREKNFQILGSRTGLVSMPFPIATTITNQINKFNNKHNDPE